MLRGLLIGAFGGGVIAIVITGFLLAIFYPLVAIWSVNTLFGFSIAFTVKNYFAALVLVGVLSRSSTSSKEK